MLPEAQNPLLLSIQRTLRWMVIATVALYLITFSGVAYVYVEITTANSALCTFRGELEDQVTGSTEFLAEHPEGLPKLGLTAAQIREGVHKQELAITSLSSLSC